MEHSERHIRAAAGEIDLLVFKASFVSGTSCESFQGSDFGGERWIFCLRNISRKGQRSMNCSELIPKN